MCASLLLGSLACRPSTPTIEHDAVIEPDLRAACEGRCARFEECAPVVDAAKEGCSVSQCEAHALDERHPCFDQEYELFVCRVERLTCEEYFDPDIEASSRPACTELALALDDCIVDLVSAL